MQSMVEIQGLMPSERTEKNKKYAQQNYRRQAVGSEENLEGERDGVQERQRTTTDAWKGVRRVSEEDKSTGDDCTYGKQVHEITQVARN